MSEAEAVQNPTEAVAPVEEKAIEQPEATETKETGEAEKKNGANILKTTAKIDRDNAANNRKFDPSVRQVTDDPEEIRKQVRKPSRPHPKTSYILTRECLKIIG